MVVWLGSEGIHLWVIFYFDVGNKRRPVLLNTFINDLEDTVECTLVKASDDIKWVGPDGKLEGRAIVQRHFKQDGGKSL